MQKKIRLLALVTAVVLLGGSAAWSDDFYVIAAVAGGHQDHQRALRTINNPGFYFLAGNLTYSGTGTTPSPSPPMTSPSTSWASA